GRVHARDARALGRSPARADRAVRQGRAAAFQIIAADRPLTEGAGAFRPHRRGPRYRRRERWLTTTLTRTAAPLRSTLHRKRRLGRPLRNSCTSGACTKALGLPH